MNVGLNLTQKIIKAHLVDGVMEPGTEIGICIDQTLTQDSTGTMAYLQLEAMGIERVKTKLSVAYIDHNMMQQGFENADDHKYLQTIAGKYGIYYSRPGNGICHQVHLERFGVPGQSLLGSDSHTPTNGGISMLAIGAGGLDVAAAMAGEPYYVTMPQVINVKLVGRLHAFVSAKDIILEVLRRLTVKGGVGKVIEYTGEGINSLSVPERATIANMGAELGATTSIFPSDEITRQFLTAQQRESVWVELKADADAKYDQELVIDLTSLEPLTARPHSPDNVVRVSEVGKIKIDQVAIGSCTNSSYQDLMRVARILKGRTVDAQVSLVISPGSKQVLTMLAENGALADLISAGARVLESGCGPCIGMGQAPASNAVSLRTFNRNFKGRCGTSSAYVYLVSPETAAASALTGVLTDPRQLSLDVDLNIEMPDKFLVNDNLIIAPGLDLADVEIVRGPNIKPFPQNRALAEELSGTVLIKVGDNITTDQIMPSDAKLLPYRSNIPHLAEFCLTPCNPNFPKRAKEHDGGIIVGGENYGQGSSREHAALVPLYLGVKAVLAKSFARIHRANLVNSGIVPLVFVNLVDYDQIQEFDLLLIDDIRAQIQSGKRMVVKNVTQNVEYEFECMLTTKETDILLTGGKINLIRKKLN